MLACTTVQVALWGEELGTEASRVLPAPGGLLATGCCSASKLLNGVHILSTVLRAPKSGPNLLEKVFEVSPYGVECCSREGGYSSCNSGSTSGFAAGVGVIVLNEF